jgi:hypothetical protein
MDATLANTLLQDGVPVLVVLVAAAWLVRRWLRPKPSACAKCEQAAAPKPAVRHRLRVL